MPGPELMSLVTAYAYEAPSGPLSVQLGSPDNLASITDPRGETWLELAWGDADADGRAEEVQSQTWSEGALSLAYDFDQHQTAVTDRGGHARTCRHDAAGRLLQFTNPVSAEWSWTYDDESLLNEAVEPLGRLTEWTYDAGAIARGEHRSRGNVLETRVTAEESGDRIITSRGPGGAW